MKIFVDENIPRMTVEHLRGLGHDVRDIRGTPHQGVADAEVWDLAMREGRLLITTDKGFTVHRTPPHHGILVVRLRKPNRLKIHNSVMHGMDRFSGADWTGLLVVIRDATMSTSRSGGSVET